MKELQFKVGKYSVVKTFLVSSINVFQCSIDCRRKLLESLILTGGSARMKGLYARLKDELKQMVKSPDRSYASKLGNIDSFKFYLYPNTPLEMIANWLGGIL